VWELQTIQHCGEVRHAGAFRKALVSAQDNTANRAATVGSGFSSADIFCVTYLITFACYGCHIHGEERGSVDRKHNLPGGPVILGDARRLGAESGQMLQPEYGMDADRRRVVFDRNPCALSGAELDLDGSPHTSKPRSRRFGC
jgi:hypothetical protein